MKKNWLLLFCFVPVICHALSADKQQTAHLQADSATLNHKTGISVYRGNVVLTQGTTVITANILTAYSDRHNQLIHAIATGAATKPASYSTLPDNSKLPFTATALTIDYHPPQGHVEFIGQAKALQGQDNFAGNELDYDMNNQIVVSPPSAGNRTTIIIQPDQQGK
jgi:lipopolysaccharide export system protein LptA